MSFVTKYRPRSLREIVGQPRAVRFLDHLLEDLRGDDCGAAALVLSGPPGTGKTTAAWAIAWELGCDIEQRDVGGVIEIASGQQDGRAVTDLARSLRHLPMCGSGWRVAIVNEADAMTRQAELVWLDVLENLPPKSVVVFTTNGLETMSERFQSRCQIVPFVAAGRESEDAVERLVADVLKREEVAPPADLTVFGRIGGKVNFRLALQQAYRFACTGDEPEAVPAAAPAVPAAGLTPAQKAWVTRRARAALAVATGAAPTPPTARRPVGRKTLRR
jgi:hypothetical protein